MRKFRGYVMRLKDDTRMRFLEEMIQEVEKVDLRIQEHQVHSGKGGFIQ